MTVKKAKTELEEKFYHLCEKVVVEEGLSLYDMDYNSNKSLLTVYIFHKSTGSADLKDCIRIDNAFTPYFETETWIPDELGLEVSSPGVYRFLRTQRHFQMALNCTIKITTTKKPEDQANGDLPQSLKGQKKLRGKLVEATEEGIKLEAKNYLLFFKYEEIKKAQVDPDWEEVSKRGNS